MRLILFIPILLLTIESSSQENKPLPPIFERLTTAAKDYKLDTSTPPADKSTKRIIELRNLRGGFNINEAIDFKIEEDRQKKDLSPEEAARLSEFFKSGNGKQWLDNAVIWIYRKSFTEQELKQLVKFYRKPAGQKLATEFPAIMLQTLRAGEMIVEIYKKQK